MRSSIMLACLGAAAGSMMGAAILPAGRAHSSPLPSASGLSVAFHDADIRQKVPYICRRDAYGRTCTYVQPWDQSARSDHAYAGRAYRYFQPQSQGSGYYPFYWANPQGAD